MKNFRFYSVFFIFFPLSTFGYPSTKGFYLEVPFVRQVDNYCGPATLTMVFRYWDRSVDQHELARQFQPFPKKGLSGAQLKELAVKYGFSAYSFFGHTKTILKHLRKGRPVIVAFRPSTLGNFNHFVVLAGWDDARQEWVVHDPNRGAYRRLSAKKLNTQRVPLQNWTLLILPETPQ